MEQHVRSTVGASPTDSTSFSCEDESIHTLLSMPTVPSSSSSKEAQCSALEAGTTTSYRRHSKLLQPTVLLRHWNGVTSKVKAKVKDAHNDQVRRPPLTVTVI